MVRAWMLKHVSFVNTATNRLNVDILQTLNVTTSRDFFKDAQGVVDVFAETTIDDVILPPVAVQFSWNGYDIQFERTYETAEQSPAQPVQPVAIPNMSPSTTQQPFTFRSAQFSCLRIKTTDQEIVEKMYQEIRNMTVETVRARTGWYEDVEKEPTPHVFKYNESYSEWVQSMPVPIRAAILPERYETALPNDLEQFFSNKEWYNEVAVPHRRGYLFYGLPGTGKTSTIITLAYMLKLDVFIINLGSIQTAKLFENALVSTQNHGTCRGSILVFEDIDCVIAGRESIHANIGNKRAVDDEDSIANAYAEPVAEPRISFSEFLNAIDGITTSEDQVIVMTTNKGLEDFDSALIRPGRIDVKVQFTHATEFQIRGLIHRFVKDDKAVSDKLYNEIISKGPVTMCEVQEHLIQWHFGKLTSL
jgi:hypothetical protein